MASTLKNCFLHPCDCALHWWEGPFDRLDTFVTGLLGTLTLWLSQGPHQSQLTATVDEHNNSAVHAIKLTCEVLVCRLGLSTSSTSSRISSPMQGDIFIITNKGRIINSQCKIYTYYTYFHSWFRSIGGLREVFCSIVVVGYKCKRHWWIPY